MDDHIGNILYIVITLVALALGLFGKKKKKPSQGTPATGKTSSEPGFLENLERALTGLGRDETDVVDLTRSEPDMEVEEMKPAMEPGLAREEAEYDPFREYLAAKEQEANQRSSMFEERIHPGEELSREMEPMEEMEPEGEMEPMEDEIGKEPIGVVDAPVQCRAFPG
ncbi:MAG: hypothetical protein ACWGNV_09035, partial [Bacteroidales bacterium]